jgi:hypothetical protein
MTLFGSMNWIYTWYRPEVDGDAKRLTDFILDTFLRGFLAPHPNHLPMGQRGGARNLQSFKVAGSARRISTKRSRRKE